MKSKKQKQILFEDTSTPVVVLGVGNHLSLGLIRSLGRMGVPIYAIDANRRATGFYSKYCREAFIWDIVNSPPATTIQFLLDSAKKIGKRPILIHTKDNSAALVANYAKELSESYIFPQQCPLLINSLASKKEMFFLAKKHNIPTPEASFPATRTDIERYLEYAKFPIMLKAIDGDAFENRSGYKMFITKTKEEVYALYDRYEDPLNPNFMLQEYIPGGEDSVWMFNGYFNEQSDCLFGITGKKIRQSPVYTGYTSLGVCLENETLKQMTIAFMKNISYKGILDIGYKYDKRDDKYKVLDINPRIGATFRLFVGNNGLDVARAKYLDLTKQIVPESHIIEGRKWFVEDRDILSSIKYYRDKNITLSQWLNSFRGVQEGAWFAWDDLSPFVLTCAKFAKGVLTGANPNLP